MKNILSKIITALAVSILIITSILPMTASAATVSELRNKVISVAQGEIGYTPEKENITKYGEWYGYQGPWCTTFAIWCVDQADKSMGTKMYKNIVPSGGSCVSMRNWFINKGDYKARTTGYQPQGGDFIFFDWNGDGNSQHVGIVESSSSSTVTTIEGNASGKVKRNSYAISKSTIMGYGVPNYSAYGNGSSDSTTKPDNSTTTPSTSAPDKSVNPYSAIVTTDKLNVRNSPSSNGGVITTLAKDTMVTVTATNGNWLKITFNKSSKDNVGYVSNSYVSAYTPTTTQPETTKATTAKVMELTGMRVSADTDQLLVGDTVKLNYTLKPEGVTANVVFKSLNSDIISVDTEGNVTALASGEGSIQIIADGKIERNYTFFIDGDAVEAIAPLAQQAVEIAVDDTTSKAKGKSSTTKTETKNEKLPDDSVDTSPDLTVTFIATGACALGIAGFIPALKKRKKQDSENFISRIDNIKK